MATLGKSPSSSASSAPAPAANELLDLDFTAPGLMEALTHAPEMPEPAPSPPPIADIPAPRVELSLVPLEGEAPPPAIATAPAVVTPEKTRILPDVIEAVARLYADDQMAAARDGLIRAIDQDALGDWTEFAWQMLFETHQALDEQAAFEQRALDFAARFEKSPPTWREVHHDDHDPALSTGGTAFVSMSGTLGARAAGPLQQLAKIADKRPSVRLDLSRIADTDNEGCRLLLGTLQHLQKTRKAFLLGGADHVAALLKPRLKMGTPQDRESWLLLLALYQHLYLQSAFEETAVEYAVTFEESPPSWDPMTPSPAASKTPAKKAGSTGYALPATIAGDATFERLAQAAGPQHDVAIDAGAVRLITVSGATRLRTVLERLKTDGKTLRILRTPHCAAAVLTLVGADACADIELRKN